jgi:hypothetical protein
VAKEAFEALARGQGRASEFLVDLIRQEIAECRDVFESDLQLDRDAVLRDEELGDRAGQHGL